MKPVHLKLSDAFSRLASEAGLDTATMKYCLARFRKEGVSFFIDVLPKLSAAVLEGLEKGFFNYKSCTQFARKGRLLKQFRLLSGIFDSFGRLKPNYDVVVVWRLRQICEYLYKLAFSFSERQLDAAVQKWYATEAEVRSYRVDPDWVVAMRKNLITHYGHFAKATVDEVFSYTGVYRDTSGAFAGSSRLPGDVPFYVWKKRPGHETKTHSVRFGAHSGYFKPYPSAPTRLFETGHENVCEVLFVPKDGRGPRVISKEPLPLIRAQMAYYDFAVDSLQSVSRGRIQFKDQSINQELARKGSLDGSLATLDLKEASDRVSFRLVAELFRYSPGLHWFVANTRSYFARVPDGHIVRLAKLAGMGSGLTFPTMALLIHLSICTQVERLGYASYAEAMAQVYVYGDDVVVPKAWYRAAVESLAKSGLMVNKTKSFRTGPFRESCGGDFCAGNPVQPVRLKLSGANLGERSDSLRLSSPLAVLELERHCRELVKAGWVDTAAYYYEALRRSVRTLPKVRGDAPFLGVYTRSVERRSDAPVVALRPLPVLYKDNQVCPYKFLSDFLRSDRKAGIGTWDTLLGLDTLQREFGELATPRTIKIVPTTVPNWVLG